MDNCHLEPSAKRAKNCQRFKDTYSKEFPCLKQSKLSINMAFCGMCSKDFNIAHGGRDDCRRHVSSKKHMECAKNIEKTKTLSVFFKSEDSSSSVKAETLFARFLIEHNLPISTADHAKSLFCAMFPDSKIAKNFSSGRTKTTEIVKSMAKRTTEDVISALTSPFSISTDGSNDCYESKLYPLLTTFFEKKRGKIVTMLMALLTCTDNTGEGIFNAICNKFDERGVLWENCIAFSSDNASTMMGKIKGVSAFIQKINPSTVMRGCPCHLIHIAAKKAASEFSKVINIEMLLVDIYFFLDKSSKRQHSFKLCQQLCGPEGKPHKILKYTSTRWLSLAACVERILEQWDPLKAFFCESRNIDDIQKKRFKNVSVCLRNEKTKLYVLFLSNTLPIFNKVNVTLQQDAPFIHKLHPLLQQLFMDLIVRFILPSAIDNIDGELILSHVAYKKRSKQKDNENLVIGVKTRMYLNSSKIAQQDIDEFYGCVRNFFVEACNYILIKLPLEDEFLKHAQVADIEKRAEASFNSLLYIVQRFPTLVGEKDLEKLEIEFAKYQSDSLKEISAISRADEAWSQISNLKDYNGEYKYKILSQVMLGILVIPHSNAASERIFSIVRKNHTSFRPNLGTETLEALLIEKVKMSMYGEVCFELKNCKESHT